MKKLLIALVAGAFAATAWAQGAAPAVATPAPEKIEAKKVATAKTPKTISVKEQLKKKPKKSARHAASSAKPAAGEKPAK